MMVSARLTPEAKAALIRQHLDDGVPLTRLAAAAGLPARTLRRWAASYRIDPTASALQRQERSDLGRRRLPEDLVAAIEALAPPDHRLRAPDRRPRPRPRPARPQLLHRPLGRGRDRPGVADPGARRGRGLPQPVRAGPPVYRGPSQRAVAVGALDQA